MKKSNKEIARSIAETVYGLQSEGDFFYMHLSDEHGIVDKFAEKILADEDHKEVMISMMSADILADIIRDPKDFIANHSDENREDVIGYHPNDLEYDGRMTEHISNVYQDPAIRTKYMDMVHQEMPVKKFQVTAKFVTYGTAEIEAVCYDAAMEAAELMDGADFITDDKGGDFSIYTAEEIS